VIVMAFGMLRAEDPEIARDQNKAEKLAIWLKQRQDRAIAPFVMPIIAKPGALTIIIANQASSEGKL
jgi:small neutral amino acid transporter SnatA (MarC family)